MFIWFVTIACLGLPQIIKSPSILLAFNPYYGFGFLGEHPGEAVAMLANVTLAITGSEALYADLSHFSRPAIARAWNFMVAPCLMINYLGQAAHAIDVPGDVGQPLLLARAEEAVSLRSRSCPSPPPSSPRRRSSPVPTR